MASFFQGGCECSKMERQMNKKAEEAFNLVNLPPFTQETKGGDIYGGKKTRKINKFPDGKRFKVNGKSKSKKTLANKLGKMMIGGDGVSVPSKTISALIDVYKQAKEMKTLLEAINKALERSIEESKKDSDKSSYLTAMQSYKKQVNASIRYLDSIINDVTNTDVINEAVSTDPKSNDEIYKLMQAVDDDPDKVNELVATMSNMFSAYVYADELRGSVENGAKLVEELLAANDPGKENDIKATILKNISKSNLTSDQQSKLLEVIDHFNEHRETLKYVSNVQGGASIDKFDADIRMRNSIRKALAVAFVGGLGERLNKIVDELNFADKFGTSELPVTDEMTRFGVHLSNISDFADKDALFALIGLDLSNNGLTIKAAYLRSLSNLHDTIDALLRNGKYNSISTQLNSIKSSVNELTAYINSFYDRITSTNDMLKYTKEQIHAAVTPSGTRGGTIEDIRKEMDKVNIDTTILLRISEFMDKFKYRMTLSNVESSMLNNASVLDKNSKDYEETLAKLIAKQINELNKDRDLCLSQYKAANANADDIEFIRNIYTSKKEFYELVEATELHLKNFNNNVVNKSKEISDLVGLLNKVNFNSDWYTATNLNYFTTIYKEIDNNLVTSITGVLSSRNPSQDINNKYKNRNADALLGSSPLLTSILAMYLKYATNNKYEFKNPPDITFGNYILYNEMIFIDYNVLTVCLKKLLQEFFDKYVNNNIYEFKDKDGNDIDINTIPIHNIIEEAYVMNINEHHHDIQFVNLITYIAKIYDEYITYLNSRKFITKSYYYDDVVTEINSSLIYDIFTVLDKIDGELGNVRSELTTTTGELSNVKSTLDSTKTDLDDARDKLTATKKELDDTTAKLGTITTDYNNVTNELGNVRGELDAARQEDNRLKEKLKKSYDRITQQLLEDINSLNNVSLPETYYTSNNLSGTIRSFYDSNNNIKVSKLIKYYILNEEYLELEYKVGGTIISDKFLRYMTPLIYSINNINQLVAYILAIKDTEVETYLESKGNIKLYLSLLVYMNYISNLIRKSLKGTMLPMSYAHYINECGIADKVDGSSIPNNHKLDFIEFNNMIVYTYIIFIYSKIRFPITPVNSFNDLSDLNKALLQHIREFTIIYAPYDNINTYPLSAHVLERFSKYLQSTIALNIFITDANRNSLMANPSMKLFVDIILYHSNLDTASRRVLDSESNVRKDVMSSFVKQAKDFITEQFFKGGKVNLIVSKTKKAKDFEEDENSIDSIKSLYKSNALLQNIIEIITKITTNDSKFMKPIEIYRRLFNYIIYSCYTIPKNDTDQYVLSLTNIEDLSNKINMTHILKAFCAKLFIALGVFDINNTNTVTSNSFSTVRLLVGGSNEVSQNNTIYNEITELYIRFPLVIALHKDLFTKTMNRNVNPEESDADDDGSGSGTVAVDSDALTIIPEMTGVYENLLKFMFSYDRIGKDIQYNSSDISFIVRCINDIYLKQKDKYANSPNVSISIIQDYINTINEKYTILDITQRDKLIDQINNSDYYENNKKYTKKSIPDNASYNQLNGEVGNYTAPSSKYTINTGSSIQYDTIKQQEFSFDKGIPDIFKAFKNIMYQTLIDPSNTVASLKPLVTEAKRALTLAKSEQEKYNIIAKYIQNNQIKSISEYVYDLFLHEMVDVNIDLLVKHLSIINELYNNIICISHLVQEDRINELINTYNDDNNTHYNNIVNLNQLHDIETFFSDLTQAHYDKINSIIYQYRENNNQYLSAMTDDVKKSSYKTILFTILLDNILQCTSSSDLIAININKNVPVLNFEKFITEVSELIYTIKGNINILSKVIINNNTLTERLDLYNQDIIKFEDKLDEFSSKKKYKQKDSNFNIIMLNESLKYIYMIENSSFADTFHTLVMDSLLNNYKEESINTTRLFNGLVQLPSDNNLYYYNSNDAPSYSNGSIFKTLNHLIASLLNVSYDKILQKVPPSLFQTLNNNIFNNSGNGTQSKLDIMPDPISYIKDCIANGSTLINKNNIMETLKNMGLQINGEINIKLLDALTLKTNADSMLVKANNIEDKITNRINYTNLDSIDQQFLENINDSNLFSHLDNIIGINADNNMYIEPLVIYTADKNTISIPIDAADFSRNVQSGMHSNTFNNIPVKHIIPTDDTILYYSLSELIKHLINTKNDKVDTFKYRADATTSLDMNVQDTIFINYPIIENMLSILQKKIKNIKLLMSCVEDENLQFSMNISDMHLYLPEKTSYSTILKDTQGDEVRNIFNNYFNRANTSISLLLSCINTTLSELSIKSEYFEITNEFNKHYHQMNNMSPLGLISLSTLTLRSTLSNRSKDNKMFNPEKSSNNIQKIKRGNRSLLGRLSNSTEDISKNQNIVNILSIFNNSNFDKFDETIFANTIKLIVKNVQYLNNYYNNTLVFSSTGYSCSYEYIDAYPRNSYMIKDENTSLSRYLVLVEDTDQSNQLASMFNKKVQVESNAINMANIIDLNISPININMLHNEIPGIYLFNYNNIFDINVIQMLKINSPDTILDNTFDVLAIGADNANYVLADNLINPYRYEEHGLYIKQYIEAFVNSDNSIKEFGSAKFLSDVFIPQVFYNMKYEKADDNEDQYNNSYTFSYELMQIINTTNVFDNIHTRNLFFLTNLQRIIIHRINKEALKHTSVFTKGLALIDSSNTEFYGKKAYSIQNDKDIYTNSIEDRSGTLRK